jgi:protein-tyrosine phosphatase
MINGGLGLVPLANFAKVRKRLYRSAQPKEAHAIRWIAEHGFKLVVDLRRADERREEKARRRYGRPRVVHIAVKDDAAPTRAQLQRIEGLVRKSVHGKGKPKVLIHCKDGHGRTSTVCAYLRMHLDGLSAKEAIDEERDKYGYIFTHVAQLNALR